MVTRVIRLLHQPGSNAGTIRALAGWTITFTGLVLLATQLYSYLSQVDGIVHEALLGGAMAASATALGALPVIFMRRISIGTQSVLLGFSAGVMLAASIFSLLLPSYSAALTQNFTPGAAALLVASGVTLGALFLFALDKSMPHSHVPKEAGSARERSATAVWLFVLAIALHNIPEGLAIGVAAGTADNGHAVATGISLQNVPEGLIVAIALLSAGYRRLFAVTVAALSGLVEPMAAIIGSTMVVMSENLLPWGLAGAAGAMLFVLAHEIIPESRRYGYRNLAAAGLIGGAIIMLLLDQLLT